MALISVPNEFEWLKKPPFWQTQAYGLDWDNPLTNGLVGCWTLNELSGLLVYDLANRKTGSLNTNTRWESGGLYFDKSSSCGVACGIVPLPNNGPFSICVLYTNIPAFGYSALISYAASDRVASIHSNSGGEYFDSATTIVSSACITFSGSKHNAYFNGTVFTDNETNYAGANSSTSNIYIGSYPDFSVGHKGSVYLALLYKRVIEFKEYFSFHLDPYQVYHTPRWSYFVDLGGAPPAGFLPSWAWRKVYTIGGGTSVSS